MHCRNAKLAAYSRHRYSRHIAFPSPKRKAVKISASIYSTAYSVTTNSMDILEESLKNIRDCFIGQLANKDLEVTNLKGEMAKRDNEHKEVESQLSLRITQLEQQLARSDKRIAEMSKSVSKLASFKQNVLSSFADDLEEFRGVKLSQEDDIRNNPPPPQPTTTTLERSHSPQSSNQIQQPVQPQQYQQKPTHPNVVTMNQNDYGQIGSTPPPPASAGASSTVHVDGREFFKKARALLSYDEFTQLLWNVKAYNNREQSRHKTLESLAELLGDRHRDLYSGFEKLLAQK